MVDPPNKESLIGIKPERKTYRDVERAIDATAEALVERGIKKDDIIVLQLPNCWELAMLYLAISRAGGISSPVPMQWQDSELEYICGLTSAKAIITVDSFRHYDCKALAERIRKKHPTIEQIITLQEIREMAVGDIKGICDHISLSANDVFTICWSSGTEAKPKGCPLSHNNWMYKSELAYETIPIQPGFNLITAGPMVNMASIGTVYIAWIRGGGKLVLHHPFDGDIFTQQIVEEKVQYTLLVPAVVNMILQQTARHQYDLSEMKVFAMGAAPPSIWAVEELRNRWGIEFVHMWGQNEGTGLVSGPADLPDFRMRFDHFPYAREGSRWSRGIRRHTSLKIVDPVTGQEVKEIGGIGELYYKSPSVIPCYFKMPDLTRKAFDEEGYFRTGDLFQLKDNDCIGFFERTRDIIIRGGFNISAQEIENLLIGHPAITDAAAIPMPDERVGERVCLYVVPRDPQLIPVNLDLITSFMKKRGIAVYKLPERLEIIERIPRNATGKILRHVLKEDFQNRMMQSH